MNEGAFRVDAVCSAGVPRARLHDRLGRPVRLVLVRAPRGYGKAELVAGWLGCSCCRADSVVWIDRPSPGTTADGYRTSTDARIAAAHRTGYRCRPATTTTDPNTDPNTDSTTGTDGATEERSPLVVLDRVDLLGAGAEEVVLDLLRRHPHVEFVATCCGSEFFEDVAALEPSHDLLVAEDLVFTEDDAERLAAAEQVFLEPGELGRLHRRVHGLPALERVAIGSARGVARGPGRTDRLDRAVDRVMTRYIRDRVLGASRLPGVDEATVLRLAPARELSPEVVSFLTGSTQPQVLLAQLDATGVLGRHAHSVQTRWEFAPAVREVLLGLAREAGIDTAAELEALARFHLDRDEPLVALPLTVDAEAWEFAATLVEENWVSMVPERMDLLRSVLELLPDEVLTHRPALRLGRDMFTFSGDRSAGAVAILPTDPEELAELGASDRGERALAGGAAQSMMLRVAGEVEAAAAFTRRIVPLAEAAAAAWPEQVVPQLALLRLQWAITYQLAGDFAASTRNLQMAYSNASARGPEFVARNAAGSLALNWALVGEVNRAREWLDTERRHVEPSGSWLEPKVRIAGLTARVLIAIDRLDLDGARAARDEIGELDETEELWAFVAHADSRYALVTSDARNGLTQLHRHVSVHRNTFRDGVAAALVHAAESDLRLALGEGNRVLRLADSVRPDDPWTAPAVARAHLLTGDTAAALTVARRVEWSGRHHLRAHLDCLIVEAAAALGDGDTETASATWKQAHRVSEQTGMLAPFSLLPLRARTRLDALAGTAGIDGLDAVAAFPDTVPVVHLTDRERAVLEQLATGRPLREIADALFVSINTVKSQLRSLYRKLDAHSRDEVLAAARGLELLR